MSHKDEVWVLGCGCGGSGKVGLMWHGGEDSAGPHSGPSFLGKILLTLPLWDSVSLFI